MSMPLPPCCPATQISLSLTAQSVEPAASVATLTGAVQEATSLVMSEQVKLTMEFELFHPAALGGGCHCACDGWRYVVSPVDL
jgi:hypothetical protein